MSSSNPAEEAVGRSVCPSTMTWGHGWLAVQSGDHLSGMKIVSQESLRERMGQIHTLPKSISQPRCSMTKASPHNLHLPQEITTLEKKKKSQRYYDGSNVTSGLKCFYSTQGRCHSSPPLIPNKYLLSGRLLHVEVNYRLWTWAPWRSTDSNDY